MRSTRFWAILAFSVIPADYALAKEVIEGHDPQLERAVLEALRLLAQSPVRRIARPAPIDRASKPKP